MCGGVNSFFNKIFIINMVNSIWLTLNHCIFRWGLLVNLIRNRSFYKTNLNGEAYSLKRMELLISSFLLYAYVWLVLTTMFFISMFILICCNYCLFPNLKMWIKILILKFYFHCNFDPTSHVCRLMYLFYEEASQLNKSLFIRITPKLHAPTCLLGKLI